MTVHELIDTLIKIPNQNLDIIFSTDVGEYYVVDKIEVVNGADGFVEIKGI